MVGWHYRLNRQELAQTPRDSEGQGSLACCSAWSHKKPDTTERLNNSTNQAEFYRVYLRIYLRCFSALVLNGLKHIKDFIIFTIPEVLGRAQEIIFFPM